LGKLQGEEKYTFCNDKAYSTHQPEVKAMKEGNP
jgi:hypothetical protein